MSAGEWTQLKRTERDGRLVVLRRHDLNGETRWYFGYNLGYCAGTERYDNYEDALARYRATRDQS